MVTSSYTNYYIVFSWGAGGQVDHHVEHFLGEAGLVFGPATAVVRGLLLPQSVWLTDLEHQLCGQVRSVSGQVRSIADLVHQLWGKSRAGQSQVRSLGDLVLRLCSQVRSGQIRWREGQSRVRSGQATGRPCTPALRAEQGRAVSGQVTRRHC